MWKLWTWNQNSKKYNTYYNSVVVELRSKQERWNTGTGKNGLTKETKHFGTKQNIMEQNYSSNKTGHRCFLQFCWNVLNTTHWNVLCPFKTKRFHHSERFFRPFNVQPFTSHTWARSGSAWCSCHNRPLLFVMRVWGCCAAIYDTQMLWGGGRGGRIAHSYWNFMDFFWTMSIWNLLEVPLSEWNSPYSTLDKHLRTLLITFTFSFYFNLS